MAYRHAGMRYDVLDAVRGYAILTITFNHVGDLIARLGHPHLRIPTLSQTDFSSAAELFVIVSGFLFGIVYAGRRRPGLDLAFISRCLKRMAQLYLANVALFAAVGAIVWLAPPAIGEATGFTLVFETRASVENLVPRFLVLAYAPFITDVFVLYIYLIALALLLETAPLSDWARVALSLGLYLAFYRLTETGMNRVVYLGFNPLTWQVLFILPAILGRRLHRGEAARAVRWLAPPAPDRLLVIGLALVAVSVAASVGAYYGLYRLDRVWHIYFQKFGLPFGRALHAMLVFATLCLLFAWLRPRWPRVFALLATIGSHSMAAFIAGAVAVYGLGALWTWLDGGRAGYVAALAIALACVTGFAILWHRLRRAVQT